MNKKELVSIIVPVYNGEKYIRECIDSIINQDYKNIEVIVVNDGSKDNSLNVIKQYAEKDKRIIVIDRENGGVSAARNSALDIVKGKYICLIDQDDCIVENYISYFLKLIKDYDCEISLCPKARKFTGNVDTSKVITDDEIVNVWSGIKSAQEMLFYNIIIGPWNKMISKKIIDDYNIRFNEEFFGGEGFSFSIECLQRAKKVAVTNKQVYLYRVDNPNSGTTKFSLNMMKSNIAAQKYIKEILVDQSKRTKNSAKYSNWHTYCDNLNTIVGCKVIKDNKTIYNEIKRTCRKDSVSAFFAPIPIKEKIKAVLYFISPYMAARIVNRFRMRKYTIEED